MDTAVNFELHRGDRPHFLANLSLPWLVGIVFAVLIAAQTLGFLVLGTGHAGRSVSECFLILHNFLALACVWIAFRRAQGITALFWFLFAVILVVLLVPTTLQAYQTLLGQPLLSDSTWRLLYCLYGAPILMMLFLPDTYRRARVKSEILLDLFQVAIVVGLIYSTFFFLPAQGMLPADALLRDVSVSDAQSLLLMVALLVRLQFARVPGTRDLLVRLGLFLLVCAVATFIGDVIDLHDYSFAAAWFDLAWSLPLVTAGLAAVMWKPGPEPVTIPEPADFPSFLGTNLVLVAMLSGISLLMNRWKEAYGGTLANAAVAASLLAFALRLALTQFHQQQEISQRKAAQLQLAASHEKIGRLLDHARRQTAEITQISELGSLLQACASREEVFRLVPERLRRLFPGASGCVALLSSSKNRLEGVAKWGVSPANQIFAPDECWAMRRGCPHAHSGSRSDPRCPHFLGEGPSVCIPLVANGDVIGVFTLQDDDPISLVSDADANADSFARRRHLASSVAEHIAVAVANLNLREALRLEAIRDPLTGLYNRRYMLEFLERELHSARRKHRPVSVMMLDLDHYKRYNDTHGHSVGDQALAAVGEILLHCLRAEDVACRYGGEEFALVLPECSLQQAMVRAEEIRKRLKEYRGKPDHPPIDALTVSIGVAAFDETTDRVDLLLKFADDALYEAKRGGRDRVVAARPAAALPESEFAASPVTVAST